MKPGQMHVKITTGDPTMRGTPGAETVQQEFTVRGPRPIKPRGLKEITQHCIRLFKGTLMQNNITQHEWPPKHVEVTAHNDMKGLQLLLRVRARPPGVLAVRTGLVDASGRKIESVKPTKGGLLSTSGMTKQ